MKSIKLKTGFLVRDWDGTIEPINYTSIEFLHYGNQEERFLFCDKDGIFSEPISKYNSDKIFDSLIEAEKHSEIKKQERIKYCLKQIKEYTERLKEYQSK
jgi:hypothetical protein